MKTVFIHTLGALLLLFGLAACDALDLDEESDPNGLSIDALEDPSRDEIGNLAAGIESGARIDVDNYLVNVGMLGREYYRFSASDPRLTADLLGAGSSVLDNNTFYITRPWGARYRVVRNAELMIEAIGRVDDVEVLTEEEQSAALGFAQTFLAHQLLMNLNLTFQNGVRIDVSAEDEELGPLVGYEEALLAIADTLDAAHANLLAGGAAFPFPLSEGFIGFDTPATFAQVNRGLAARVAAYREDFDAEDGVLALLEGSFLDPAGDLRTGAYHVFSTDPVGLTNPFFLPLGGTGEVLAAHPSYVSDLEPGDTRLTKVAERQDPFSRVDLFSNHDVFVYETQVSPIPIVRNAELVLLRAEARIQTGDLAGAAADLNVIRNAAGLPDYTAPEEQAALTDEMLRQRRYELYAEGHRWVDVRRYNLDDCSDDDLDPCLNDDLPIDRPGDDVWLQFPVPARENVE